jgi:formylglycine-generating enzyme required for sulfatase activity
MTVRITLSLLLALAALVNLPATDALAKPRARPKPPEQKQVAEPPPAPGRQYFATKAVEPLTPEIEQQLKPRDSFKECDNCPEMVVIPKGTFMMGTPADEPYRYANEGPQHRVTIPRPIAVGRFTITFDEWDACVADGGCNGKGDDRGFGRTRMPANGITFEGTKAYLAWLSKKLGRTYRLPSESEREYFTRAGSATPFWFGKTITMQYANYDATNNYPGGPYGTSSKGPKPVDAYPPNKFGLYQVVGNAQEWVADCYNKYFNPDAPTDGSPWLEGDCDKRILRSGGWMGSAHMQRSGYRSEMNPVAGYSFRVVRDVHIQ